VETTHFALKGALEYTVVGARGAKLYRFKKGEPLAVAIPEDVRKFRGQPDLFYECDASGRPLDPAAVVGRAAPAPRSFRSFRADPEPAPPPPAPLPASTPASPPAGRPALSEEAGRPAAGGSGESAGTAESGGGEAVPGDAGAADAARRHRRSRGGP
jgi:hypothetical protein